MGSGPTGPAPYAGAPVGGQKIKPVSDARFRSFAERWVTARCHLFKQETIQQETWECIQNARTAYSMIKQVGYNKFEDDPNAGLE